MDMMIAESAATRFDRPVIDGLSTDASIGWNAITRNKLEGYVRNNVRQSLGLMSRPLDLTACTGRAIQLAKAAMSRRGPELHSDLLAPLVTVGDERLLARAMASLIAAVTAHSRRDTTASCKLTLQGDTAVFAISVVSDASGREQIQATLGGVGTHALRPLATPPGQAMKPWLARLILEEHQGRVRLVTSFESRTTLEIELPGAFL